MKPVRFDYERPDRFADAVALLGGGRFAKLIAGGQSLGPMLNLRLAAPDLLVDIGGLHELPEAVDARGLEATEGYKPAVDTGVFSYATHAAVVAVDPEIGTVEILDYVIVEDGGRLVNPMIVDGQIWGGAAQGIGTALYEEMPYDASGQPMAPTLGDYLLPGFTEVPEIDIHHMMTPSPHTEFGVKGLGEGGAIAPPAALGNAINDALKGLGAEIGETPMTPRRILEAIRAARRPEMAR